MTESPETGDRSSLVTLARLKQRLLDAHAVVSKREERSERLGLLGKENASLRARLSMLQLALYAAIADKINPGSRKAAQKWLKVLEFDHWLVASQREAAQKAENQE